MSKHISDFFSSFSSKPKHKVVVEIDLHADDLDHAKQIIEHWLLFVKHEDAFISGNLVFNGKNTEFKIRD
jgi:hypothetical protein